MSEENRAPDSRIKEPSHEIVVIEDLSKSYLRGDQEIPVLRNISLTVAGGDYLALMGPSGSGKTTLLNLIAGIDTPDGGILKVGGVDISEMGESELSRWRATHVGFIFQFYNLIPVLSALENVELPLLLTSMTRRVRREHAEAALGAVGLSDRMDHYPSQLSGGQQQRVAIARAIVTDPLIVVADEPTGDLDKKSATDVLDLLGQLNELFNKTIIMVTHDPRAARRSKRILYLDKGVLADSLKDEF
jgi:putative ABC transport system ATP-binding protein